MIFYVFTKSKVRKNHRARVTYINSGYTDGDIEFRAKNLQKTKKTQKDD